MTWEKAIENHRLAQVRLKIVTEAFAEVEQAFHRLAVSIQASRELPRRQRKRLGLAQVRARR